MGQRIRTNSTKLTLPTGMGLRRRLCYAIYTGGRFILSRAFCAVFIYLGWTHECPHPNQHDLRALAQTADARFPLTATSCLWAWFLFWNECVWTETYLPLCSRGEQDCPRGGKAVGREEEERGEAYIYTYVCKEAEAGSEGPGSVFDFHPRNQPGSDRPLIFLIYHSPGICLSRRNEPSFITVCVLVCYAGGEAGRRTTRLIEDMAGGSCLLCRLVWLTISQSYTHSMVYDMTCLPPPFACLDGFACLTCDMCRCQSFSAQLCCEVVFKK